MKCGSGHDHPDAASVRACYAKKYGGFKSDAELRRFDAARPVRGDQSHLMGGNGSVAGWALEQERDRAEAKAVAAYKASRDAGMDAGQIARREAAGQRTDFAARRAAWSQIRPGGYAVESRTGTNDLDFWWVDRPSSGKWAGYTFVKRHVGAPGGIRQIQLSSRESFAVLDALAALTERQAAFAREQYGVKIGKCFTCGSPLTDEVSRLRGQGPECFAGRSKSSRR